MGNQGTLTSPVLVRAARRPAGGRAGRGDVVAQRLAVMGRTWRRFARERSFKREEMDVLEKANDGKSKRALFSGIAGDSLQQVVLCFDWCALEVLPNPSTHTEGHVIVFYPSTGKPSALKGACSVWTGGKSASSYLSVLRGKLY